MDYVFEFSRGKEYLYEASLFELFTEMDDVVSENDLLHDVNITNLDARDRYRKAWTYFNNE